ncbi:MAG: hypothetical protein COV08_03405 [Candidatus Vogelbacteria bacterium CG10_big_fil_rev_8_21_14_0_10_49_38]|uniref:Uncharacterized protein n=1 Tax=Candidatus Vogelbacteria bacterium CG10_big_fil_rev_8_21_14_0_10_49_38 TaxID=1975043 RepID=A0A2H0RH51_9BACT|nr:MAG: hypothetical protein BK006_03400 [bacterium CG10_49_38]PIR45787.1 MAG: hypothetical protein COV08_03405 [Candidatus Vogelbacteria bacterium CG10_big_fil_rev_8_21_14_0_10_49_38]
MGQNKSWFRKHKIGTAIFIFIILLVMIAITNKKKGESPNIYPSESGKGIKTAEWDSVRAKDVPRVANEWKKPVRLEVSEDGKWEDSLFVTLDGGRVYFIYYPGDLITDIQKGKYKTNLKIYFSDKPFTTKVLDDRPYFNEKYWSPAGPSLTASGDMFYHSNKPIEGDKGRYLSHIYKNDQLLPFNTADISYGNPQYCSGKDELWFDNNDKVIYVLKNAEADNFQGVPTLAPKPINSYDSAINDHQPWLSDDCKNIYFSSTRNSMGSGPFIYTSERIAEDEWSEPRLVVKSNIGVGEATLTADMKKLFFLQVLRNPEGQFTSNLFYMEKK